ncbi:PilZ domain-containing protein [Shewanella sp. AS1]|uniref:PilZ domain-containing protein n=1 Tax=Shewanella sp. AS1 TaxID=2907626 RepID=UPI001F15759E|nr:PilZ domain-containing protein [Shewanella sp. AS1]MCE9678703.1 PilZ domain-containing protein [Shewanella sp. AS1]
MNQYYEELDERRQSQRIDLEADHIHISWTDDEGESHLDNATCLDLSRRGVLIAYPRAFNQGEILLITFNPETSNQNGVTARVCRCTKTNTEFHIAMEIIA